MDGAGVDGGEFFEGAIDGEELFGVRFYESHRLFEDDPFEMAEALAGVAGAGMFDENAAHDESGGGEELGAAFPADGGFDEAEEGFVDEGGRLEGVIAAFGAHGGAGEGVEFAMEGFEEIRVGGGGAVLEQGGDVGHGAFSAWGVAMPFEHTPLRGGKGQIGRRSAARAAG